MVTLTICIIAVAATVRGNYYWALVFSAAAAASQAAGAVFVVV